MSAPRKLRIGPALGSGSARGWAHIGVIRELEAAGIQPDVVCGTSIGALVGGAYVAGELDRLEDWVQTLTMTDVIAFMDLSLSGGLVRGDRLMNHFRRHFKDRPIEQLGSSSPPTVRSIVCHVNELLSMDFKTFTEVST